MKTCVIAGASLRCYYMFAKSLTESFKDNVSLKGIYDKNITRSEYFNKTIHSDIKVFQDFDVMIDEIKPDIVIVTTIDSFHHEYCIRAMEKGCDVVCEKPMTTDEEKCKQIIDAEKRTGKKVTVTFNCRFMPFYAKIKELMLSNAIGKPLAMNFEYLLGRAHGADYFRRWHRKMENSGSLLVHKSTHHLDICNWVLDDMPKTVTALGSLNFFGPNRKNRGVRCSTCEFAKKCEFYSDCKNDSILNDFYFKAEKNDGYVRDACVFSDEIDIYDNMSLSVRYSKGLLLTYTLTTYNQYEGFKISITGSEGRIEANEYYTGERANDKNYSIKVFKNDDSFIEYVFPKSSGVHGGGDERLLKMLFTDEMTDPLRQCASSFDGAVSALIGICAVKSIKTQKTVDIEPYIIQLK